MSDHEYISRRRFGRRIFGSIGGIAIPLLSSCGKGGDSTVNINSPPVNGDNKFPVVTLEREFPNNGKVKYVVSGKDPDGFIDRIEFQYNLGIVSNVYSDKHEVAKLINKRKNEFWARAYDNSGNFDFIEDNFNVPQRNEALEHIEAILINKNAPYLRNNQNNPVNYNFNGEQFSNFDFLIERPNDLKHSFIKYVDIGDNLATQMRIQRQLNNFTNDGIPGDEGTSYRNLFLYRLPLEEIGELVKDFIDRDYSRAVQGA